MNYLVIDDQSARALRPCSYCSGHRASSGQRRHQPAIRQAQEDTDSTYPPTMTSSFKEEKEPQNNYHPAE
jgi:hypothetical protein